MHGVSSWGSMWRWWAELSMRNSPVVIRPATHCSVHAKTDFTKNTDLVQSDHGRLKTIWIFYFLFFAKLDLRECMVWSYSSLFLFRILIFFLRLASSTRETTSWLRFLVLVSKLAYEADWLLIPLPQTELLWRRGGGDNGGAVGLGNFPACLSAAGVNRCSTPPIIPERLWIAGWLMFTTDIIYMLMKGA